MPVEAVIWGGSPMVNAEGHGRKEIGAYDALFEFLYHFTFQGFKVNRRLFPTKGAFSLKSGHKFSNMAIFDGIVKSRHAGESRIGVRDGQRPSQTF